MGFTETNGCLRCGTELTSELDLQTGICPDCWTPEDEDEELDTPEPGYK